MQIELTELQISSVLKEHYDDANAVAGQLMVDPEYSLYSIVAPFLKCAIENDPDFGYDILQELKMITEKYA